MAESPYVLIACKPWVKAVVIGLCLVALGIASGVYAGVDFDRLLGSMTQRWGGGVANRFNAWQNLIAANRASADGDRLKRTNDFFNRNIVFAEDSAVWAQEDYWATPIETLGKGSGDCEDFVIAKYFTLKEMGVFVEEDLLRAQTATQYFDDEIIGASVINRDTGEEIGLIKEIWDTPANEIWVVDYNGKELPIPVIDEIVKHVNIKRKQVSIYVMPGLLEIVDNTPNDERDDDEDENEKD